MRVLILSDLGASGGAGIAAKRLVEGLSSQGSQVTWIVGAASDHQQGQTSHALAPSYASGYPFRLIRRLLPPKFGCRWNARWSQHWLACLLEEVKPDVVNVHNIHGAGWPVDLIKECIRSAPTVWTLHDMWSFSGRCVYTGSCRQFLTGCGPSCPTPNEYPALAPDRIAAAWNRRRQMLRETAGKIIAVTPSRWLKVQACAGMWQHGRVESVPNGIPLSIYAPIERKQARHELGFHYDGPVLLAAADNLTDPRKGMHLLIGALKSIGATKVGLAVFGKGQLPSLPSNVQLLPIGPLADDRRIAAAYNAADIYVHPATEDNLPNTVMEAMACGTPSIGFAVGGVPEMIRPGVTGWMAGAVSEEALGMTIRKAVADITKDSLRSSCRAVAETEYAIELQACRYQDLFASLISRSEGRTLMETRS